MQIENNNVIQTTIDHVFNELYYEFKINDTINAFVVNLSTKIFNKFRQLKRENVETIITFVNAFNKTRYDSKHRVINIKKNDIIYLRLYQEYTISNLVNFKLLKQRVDFFEIFDKIDNLVFRLQLLFVMKIYSIVFIIQLKSIILDQNFYDKTTNKKSLFIEKKNFVIVKKAFYYEIKRLFNKSIIKKHSHYLIK